MVQIIHDLNYNLNEVQTLRNSQHIVNIFDQRIFKFPNSILFDNANSAFEEIINEKWIDLSGVEIE